MVFIKLIDDFIECDRVFGPMPNFASSFEAYFIEKAYSLLFDHSPNETNDIKYISLMDENDDLKWMHKVELARNSRHQNLEIVYNNNRVYFKTVRVIHKHDVLAAFPSKDLEISLGLQFIPIHPEEKYSCKKCGQMYDYQYGLMLHTRYFCSQSTNNLFNKSIHHSMIHSSIGQSNKRKQQYEVMNPNELIVGGGAGGGGDVKRPRVISETDYRTAIYQNYLRLYQQHQLIQQQQQQHQQQQQPAIINQARLREQLTSQLLAYFEAANQQQKKLQQQSSVEVVCRNEISPKSNESCSNERIGPRRSVVTGESGLSSPPGPGLVKPSPTSELNMLMSSQVIQNWCAKCNTYFRLTSDLVHHMRTFHRKDKDTTTTATTRMTPNEYRTPTSFVTSDSCQRLVKSTDKQFKDGLQQQLKCEICNEIFKEKHHLSRHMTSHR